jgi:CDGSH-type Zn-finger protein/uncharacterized Fe-S cluster protein YjdI
MKREYTGQKITIAYDAQRCIHAERCVHGIASVFEKGGKPWVHPDGADPARIAVVIQRCPTGALQYSATDQIEGEQPDSANVIVTAPHGPLFLRGNLEIQPAQATAPEADTRAALCRCGASGNKPFCDGSHHRIGFSDEGLAAAPQNQDVEIPERGPALQATATPDGPLHVKGPFLIRNAAGDHILAGMDAWLCRCGGSNHKPFCDGSHARIGFQDS